MGDEKKISQTPLQTVPSDKVLEFASLNRLRKRLLDIDDIVLSAMVFRFKRSEDQDPHVINLSEAIENHFFDDEGNRNSGNNRPVWGIRDTKGGRIEQECKSDSTNTGSIDEERNDIKKDYGVNVDKLNLVERMIIAAAFFSSSDVEFLGANRNDTESSDRQYIRGKANIVIRDILNETSPLFERQKTEKLQDKKGETRLGKEKNSHGYKISSNLESAINNKCERLVSAIKEEKGGVEEIISRRNSLELSIKNTEEKLKKSIEKGKRYLKKHKIKCTLSDRAKSDIYEEAGEVCRFIEKVSKDSRKELKENSDENVNIRMEITNDRGYLPAYRMQKEIYDDLAKELGVSQPVSHPNSSAFSFWSQPSSIPSKINDIAFAATMTSGAASFTAIVFCSVAGSLDGEIAAKIVNSDGGILDMNVPEVILASALISMLACAFVYWLTLPSENNTSENVVQSSPTPTPTPTVV